MSGPTILDIAKQRAAEGRMGHAAKVLLGFGSKFARSKKGRRLKSGQWWKRPTPPPRKLVWFDNPWMRSAFDLLKRGQA
jgi:hypothetical protein